MQTESLVPLIASIVGIVFGAVSLVVSFLAFFRDRPRVHVTLQWDLSVTPGTKYDHTKQYGVVSVVNVGRRPIFVSHASLKLPRGLDATHLLLIEGIGGTKLAEGDPPWKCMIDQERLSKYSKHWKTIRAIVIDSAGKEYRSKRLKDRPSWAQ